MPRTDIAWSGGTEQALASAARTTNGSSPAIPGFGPAKTLRAQLNVTAASGTTPNLAVLVEDSVDGGVTWNTVIAFTAKTGTGREVKDLTTPFGDQLRISWTITGTTPSFTFAVDWSYE